MRDDAPETPADDSRPEPPAVAPVPIDPSAPPQPLLPASAPRPPRRNRWRIIVSIIVLIIIVAAGAWWLGHRSTAPTSKSQATTTQKKTTAKVQGLQLNPDKNYGNKYADGILPVGDGKYSTSGPKAGYIYACSQYAQSLTTSQGGASTRGPWFTDNNTEYDVNKKLHVEGSVMWSASFSNTVNGDTRTITTNDLPNQPTGIFPIMTTDPAYQYDHNPNSIKSQDLAYKLTTDPAYGSPSCMGGESGIMLTGVALFNALDAGGRDAGAWEVQDSCDGHPQSDGIYHYHTLSSCIKDISVHTVIGYALDGFPITGPEVGPNNFLTTDDLDECHGITSEINLNGKSVTMYHYVMTQDYPYSVSCFRGTAIEPPDLAQHVQSGSATSGQGHSGRGAPGQPPQPAS